ncbi:ABC transporter ATP-binding protein [Arvimicrobium flavum]|uniref:ABC transporter ATP-binding protein n=1 Tax=Arvimicrobium flavum TaxID=3393320 RepID=UPI00237BE48B|nr:ABC transporter ATP-binding protein [Mesorhizobium shangrilense]
MERSLARYIWTHTWRQQVWILIIVAVSMIPYFMSFDLPKQIVNGPIQGEGFDSPDSVQPFLNIAFDVPLVGHVELFSGFQLSREHTLYALSFVFLFLVVINGLFKFYINTYKGRLGERMLRRIRFELVDRVLRFPPFQFKRVKSAEVATMVKDEVEPLGGFIGDAFVQPALLGGQALTALVFILLQNFWLGMIAAVIVAIQIIIIPQMRKRLIRLGRERQLTARQLSGRVGEIVDGIGAIHIHDTSNYERADIAARLGHIFKIRYDLYQWKFLVKFLNNFLAQVTPFLFYLVGGYLALRGRVDVGQLVAVIAAYKDLPGPLKDLIDWDQARQDVQVKYNQVVEQFSIDRLVPSRVQELSSKTPGPLSGPLAASNLSILDDSGAALVERVSLQVRPGETVAIVSTSTGGGDALAEALARLSWPESGKVTACGDDLLDLPEAVTGRRISYASSDPYLFFGTLRDNLLYGLKHAPMGEVKYDGADAARRKWQVAEAAMSGNPDFDPNADWIDYASAGATGPDDLIHVVLPVLAAVDLSRDILELGLRSSIDIQRHPRVVERIVELRTAMRERLDREGLSGLVVPFEPGAYNLEATVGENLLFGAATGKELSQKELAANPYFASVLAADGLDRVLYEMGLDIAAQTVELFGDLPPDHPFFQQLGFMTAEELPLYQALLQKLNGKAFEDVSAEDRARIIAVSFEYIEPRYRFGLLTEEIMKSVIAARQRFYEGLPENLKDAIEPYDPTRYTAAATVIDNVLFGRIGHNQADGPERIRTLVIGVLEDLHLYDEVLDVGLDYNVGVGGRRMSTAQRQKLDVARAILKRADFLILNRPLLALDQRQQEHILRKVLKEVRRDNREPAVIWVLSNAAMAQLFDRVLVFDSGALVEDGTHETLHAGNGIFKTLVSQ